MKLNIKRVFISAIIGVVVITLISLTTIFKILEDNKKEEIKNSINNLIISAKTYYLSNLINGKTLSTINLMKDNNFKHGVLKLSKGYVSFNNNGQVAGEFYIDGYCSSYDFNGFLIYEKKAEKDCNIEIPVTFPIEDGTEVYFNPNTGKQCLSTEVVSSKVGVKDGCMRWYAFLDNNEEKVKLILDHNTTDFVMWNKDGGTAPDTLMKQLKLDIESWDERVKESARIITSNEINEIAGSLYNWNINDDSTGYYLHTGTKTQYLGEKGSNSYAWLFDNTRNCEMSGCYNQDYDTYGYWTSDYSSNGNAWSICYGGSLYGYAKVDVYADGLRPVIEVEKQLFK